MRMHAGVALRETSSRKPLLFSHPESLEQALYLLVHDSGVKAEDQAQHLGIATSYLYNCSNPHLLDQFRYPLRHLLPHSQFCRNTVVLDFLERAMGRVAVPVLDQLDLFTAPPSLDQLPAETLGLTKELGQFSAKLERSLADQRITCAEATGCRKELTDLIDKAVALRCRLEFWKD